MAKNTRKISKRRSDRRKTRTTKKHKGGGFLSNIRGKFLGKSTTGDDVTIKTKTKEEEKDPTYKSGVEKNTKDLESRPQIAEATEAEAEATEAEAEATEASKQLSNATTRSRIRNTLSGTKALMSTGATAALSGAKALRKGTGSVIGNTTSGVIKTLSQVKNTLKRPFTKIAKYPDESHHNRFFIGKREPNKTQFSISEYKLTRTKQLKDLLQEIESDAETQGPGVYTLSYFFNIGGKDETK